MTPEKETLLLRLTKTLREEGYGEAQRLPRPGSFRHWANEPAAWRRFKAGGPNGWSSTPAAKWYYRRFRRDAPKAYGWFRLLSLGETVSRAEAAAMTADPSLDELMEAGILKEQERKVASEVQITPYREWLFVHDATPAGKAGHVYLGPDSLSFSQHLWLRQATLQGKRALDLCTGAGIQAILLGGKYKSVVATDINPRAVVFARLNAKINSLLNVEVLQGDLYSGALGPFDVITANPPFLLLPEEERERWVDGFGGELGMEVALQIIEGLDSHLSPDGRAYLYATSPIISGVDRLAREISGRLAGKPLAVTLLAQHEYINPKHIALFNELGIEKTVFYFIEALRAPAFQLTVRPLRGWPKLLCTARMKMVRRRGTVAA